MNRKYFSLITLLFFVTTTLWTQEGYHIEVLLDNYDQELLLLGYHYGDKQYIKDSVKVDSNGEFVFEGQEALKPGVYIMVMPPENNFFQVLIDEEDQEFVIKTDAKAPNIHMRVEGSMDNELFYGYMDFLSKKRPEADGLKKELEAAAGAEKDKIQAKLDDLNKAVKQYQQGLVEKYGQTLTAALVKSGMEVPMPNFEGDEKEVQMKRYRHYKAHYFDNINLADERLVRSPILFQRIDYYVNKLTVQDPDSINKSIDYILEKVRPAEETFKYYLVHFLNTYAKSNIVGMDAVYVHLAEKYYATGQAPWTEEEQLKKIVDNAETLKPILIGKTAPNVKMYEIDLQGTLDAKNAENEYQRWKSKRTLTLHEVNAPYTVLFIWDPDCGHCKKSMPQMLEFYDDFKDKGVEVFAVCTKIYDEIPACAETIIEKGMIKWINVIDPFIKSKYKQLYDVRSTPQIFILDENKKIISKKIGAEQIAEVMTRILEMKEKQNGLGGASKQEP